jgi:hypothetical protein
MLGKVGEQVNAEAGIAIGLGNPATLRAKVYQLTRD